MRTWKGICAYIVRTWRGLETYQKAGVFILLLLITIGSLAPWIAPYDPLQTGTPFQSPSFTHPFGTDNLGQDNLSRLIYGIMNTIKIAFVAALVSLAIGVSVGVYSGYYRGWREDALMGVTDLFLLIPSLPLMILMASYLEPSEWNIVLVIGFLWWCPTARVVHARALQVRNQGYVRSALALGYGGPYIIWHHILPNCKQVIIAKFTMGVALAMLAEASLSFLGLGDPLSITWGSMVNLAYSCGGFANDLWWWYLPPCIMITLTAAAFFMVGGRKNEGRRWQI
ncbi:MAG: ABC transporter permease [Methanomassiliicoccales archaeon]|nr:ABC transporter permease [Methanomassiliicoccales archaeon]